MNEEPGGGAGGGAQHPQEQPRAGGGGRSEREREPLVTGWGQTRRRKEPPPLLAAGAARQSPPSTSCHSAEPPRKWPTPAEATAAQAGASKPAPPLCAPGFFLGASLKLAPPWPGSGSAGGERTGGLQEPRRRLSPHPKIGARSQVSKSGVGGDGVAGLDFNSHHSLRMGWGVDGKSEGEVYWCGELGWIASPAIGCF